jgi:hypothetical protein
VASQALNPASPKWQTSFSKPGEYIFRGNVFDAKGVMAAPCEARTYINYPPVCSLWTSCLPCEDYVGKPIVFDATGSKDPDGEIVKASFELTDNAGKVIETFVDNEKPFTWEKIFNRPGFYTITAVVFDNAGAVSSAADPCKVSFEVTQKKLFWLIEAGPLLARGTYTTFFWLRGGMLFKLVPETLDFVISGGGAIPSRGDPWTFFFMANAILELHAGPAFIGGGLGYSTKEQTIRKAGLDLVGDIGVYLFNNYANAGALFFEFRSPVGSDRKFDDHYKLLLGFRYIL